ncbi:MAG: hypothetical protein JNL57_10190 [Bacteroidetes bacterium]|nr:hypothetical protein [Bacteroidota bacterium]
MAGKKRSAGLLLIATLVVLLCLGLVLFRGYWWHALGGPLPAGAQGPEAVIENYGDEILSEARRYRISPEYLAALCLLECGGRKPAPERYEKHVYARLKMVQLGLRNNYEHVKRSHLKDAGDEALQNLASSWGPFQLMGYKCLLYDINIQQLRGQESVHWGVKWITENYGSYLKKGDYKSAFHIHNCGTPWPANNKPRTHDPKYAENGLKWMNWFKGKL